MRASLGGLLIPALLIGWLGLLSPAHAIDVRDEGKFFGKEAVEKANKKIAEIKRDYSKDLAIETFAEAPDPAEARAGLAACIDYAENRAWFHAADAAGDLAFFAHPIARIGSYLAREGGVPQGTSMAYLIAPPLEATFALDAALKVAEVEMAVWFAPPSETNFSGGYLVGEQSAVVAACEAFRDAVVDVAATPREV